MKIINLAENTEGASGCGFEHGLCFYIETRKHKLLMDTGQTDLLIRNAQKLGVDLTKVDTVVLSHGHYDHSGGILPFVKINPAAKIYVQESAFGEYYSQKSDGEPRYIGVAKEIRELPQVVIVGAPAPDSAPEMAAAEVAAPAPAESDTAPAAGTYVIDDELTLFWNIGNAYPLSSANRTLKIKKKGEFIQDDFRHEQCLVISEGNKKVLFSGCAHHGILNVLERYRELYRDDPDVVISGFHMMKKNGYSDEDINLIIDTALELKKRRTVFYTGHCTGVEPYTAMRKLMGDQLRYVHSGDEIRIRSAIHSFAFNMAEKAAAAAGADTTAAARGTGTAADRVVTTAPETGTAAGMAATANARNRATGNNAAATTATAESAADTASAIAQNTSTAKGAANAKKAAGKKRSSYMKWHKFFAWGTVACFILTMVTGYQRK